MVSPIEWIQVQVVESVGPPVTGVIRYALASDETTEAAGYGGLDQDRLRALRLARLAASGPLTVDDVIEASELTDPAALSAWIVERGEVFRPDAERLVRLADAGVSEEVIDMVIAVSHPRRFAVETGQRGEVSAEAADRERMARGNVGYSAWPIWGSGYGYGYRGYYSPYSALGYGYGGYYGNYGGYGYWGYRPTVIVVPSDGNTSGGRGRAVRGRGYSGGQPAGSGGSVRAPNTGATSGGAASSGAATKRKAKPRGR